MKAKLFKINSNIETVYSKYGDDKNGYIKILLKGEHKTFAEVSGLEKTKI